MRAKLGLAVAVAAAVIALAVAPVQAAGPTQHDPTFPAGLLTFDVRGTGDLTSNVVKLSDGDIVVAGTSKGPNGSDDSPAMVGLLPNLQPDPNFGQSNGRSILPLGDPARLKDVARGPNGTLVGLATNASIPTTWVFRVTSDGQFDPTFNSGVGSIELLSDSIGISWTSVSVGHDGLILIAGTLTPSTGPTEIAWLTIPENGDTSGVFVSSIHVGATDATEFDTATDPRSSVNRVDILAEGETATRLFFAQVIAINPTTGDFDTSFSGDGRATVTDPAFNLSPSSIAVLDTGKIVLGATVGAPEEAEIIRLTAAGALDPSFSGDGIARVPIPGFDRTTSVVASAGGTFTGAASLDNGGVAAFRLTNTGAADPSFSGDGRLSVVPAPFFVATSLVVDASNRVLIGGAVNQANAQDLALIGVTSSGSLDRSLRSASGTASQFEVEHVQVASDVAIDASGATFIAGGATNIDNGITDMVVEKLDPNGYRDPSFGGDGWAEAGFGHANATSMALAGAEVVLAGCAHCQDSDWAIARLTATGDSDPSFNGHGRMTLDWGGSADIAEGVAMQSDGRIVAVGQGNGRFAVARLKASGHLDGSFSGDGELIPIIPGTVSGEAEDVTVLPTGKILVSGLVATSTRDEVLVVRLNSDGTLDHGFNGTGMRILAPADDVVAVSGLAVRTDGRILVTGTVRVGGLARALAIQLNANGSKDGTFGNNGVAIFGFGSPEAQAVDVAAVGNKTILGLVVSENAFSVARLTAGGAPDPTFGSAGVASVQIEQTDSAAALGVRSSDGRIYEVGTAEQDVSFDFGIAAFTP
jgi:uncharacterized delta-60 repeat protein